MQPGRAPSHSSQPGNMQLPQVGRVLPGPAGKLQELAAAGALQQATPEMLGLKASSMAVLSSSQAINQHDTAFLSSSWASAKAAAAEDEVISGPLRSIKSAKEMGVGKVSRMLVVLSSFHPSGAGSAFSKVKDPSGMMGAAIHSSALQQQQQQLPLGPGCVLLLQNVSVLTPNPGSSYLAVTADNIVQAWPAEQPGRNIRHTAHQPTADQQQQQQQPVRQQEQRQPPAPSQQQRQQQHPGPAAAGQGAAAAAASGAGSRQTNSFFPPPSPDIMSVLNEMAGRGSAAAAGQGQPNSTALRHNPQHSQQQQQQQEVRQAPYGVRPGVGPLHNSQTQQQQQRTQQWQHQQQQGSEQQGEFSPAVSGVAAQQQQQQQAGASHSCSSMPPPPPRTLGPAGSQHGWQQQQQQQQRSNQQTGSQQQQYQQRHVLGTPGPHHSQQQQQQQHSQGLHRQHQGQQQQHPLPSSLFQGLSQPQQPTGSLSQGGSPAVPPAAAAVAGPGMPSGRDSGGQERAGVGGATAVLQGPLTGALQLQQGRQGGYGAVSGAAVTQGSPMPPAAALQGASGLHMGRQTAAGSGSSSQWQGSLGQNKGLAGGRVSVAAAGAGHGAAGAACDMDEDVEFDENVVAAIFGSQVGTVAPTAGHQQQQQQQRQQLSTVTGAFRSAAQHTPAGAAADAPSSTPSARDEQHQLAQRNPQIPSLQQGQHTAGKLQRSSGPTTTLMPPRASLGTPAEQQAACGPYSAAGLQPPAARPSQPHQQGQQGQQQWSLQGSMRPPVQQWGLPGRSAVSQGQVGAAGVGFGASLLGKRPAVSLLDDLVADDLDDL